MLVRPVRAVPGLMAVAVAVAERPALVVDRARPQIFRKLEVLAGMELHG
jgi:hypothetical protein